MNSECKTREKAKWKSRRRRQRHRRNGLCLDCGRKSVSNRRFCSVHLGKARTKAKHEYDWRVANGICVKCGIPKEKGRTGVKCASCAWKAAAKERRRRSITRTPLWPVSEVRASKLGLSSAIEGDQQKERNVA